MGSSAAVKLAFVIAQLTEPPSFKNKGLLLFGEVSEGSQTAVIAGQNHCQHL